MKITFEINEIDYGALVERFLPLVHDKLAEKDGTGAMILAKIATMPPEVAGKMVDMLPQTTKDEIAVMLVNKNKDNIVKMVLEYAEKNKLYFKIDDFKVK